MTPETLHQAAAKGDLVRVAAALDAGVPVDARVAESTALHVAITGRQADAVSLLLSHGADPESLAWNRTPLSLAAQVGGSPTQRIERTPSTLRIVEALIAAGARVDTCPAGERYLPLRMALETATLPVIDLLLSAGAVLRPEWAPAAIEYRRLDALPRFFERCASTLQLDDCLFSIAVHADRSIETVTAATALLVRGANPNASDEAGATPTLWAAYRRHPSLLALLVSRGGELDRATSRTWCPEDVPKKRGLSPRGLLAEDLLAEHRHGLTGDGRAEWEALAAACGETLNAWLTRLSAKKPDPPITGTWIASMARVDSDQGASDLLEAMAGDGVELKVTLELATDSTFTLLGCEALLGGSGTWRREASTVQLEFDDGDCAGETRTLEVRSPSLELRDDSGAREVSWTFERERAG